MPTNGQTIQAAAALKGRTRIVDMSTDAANLILYVRPDEDMDGEFRATCALTGDTLNVRGWELPLHDGADRRAELRVEFGLEHISAPLARVLPAILAGEVVQ